MYARKSEFKRELSMVYCYYVNVCGHVELFCGCTIYDSYAFNGT